MALPYSGDLENGLRDGEVAVMRSDLARLLAYIDRSARLLGKAIGDPDDITSDERTSEDFLLAGALSPGASDVTVHGSQPSTEEKDTISDTLFPPTTLEQWWTTSQEPRTGRPCNDHPWKPRNFSHIKVHCRTNRVIHDFEKWLTSYGKSVLKNHTPLLSLVLYRLEADTLTLSKSQAMQKDNVARLEAEADTKLEQINIVVQAFQLACGNGDYHGLWNLKLGDLLSHCYANNIFSRPEMFDEQALRVQLSRIADALSLINIQSLDGPSAPRLERPWPHLLTIGELFEPNLPQPTIGTVQRAQGYVADTFTSMNLCVAHLIRVGGIKVVWTEYLSEHLSFDVNHRLLSLYWFGGTSRAKWLKGKCFDIDDVHLRNTYNLLFPMGPAGAHETYRAYWRLAPPWWVCHYYGVRCAKATNCNTWSQLKALFPRAMSQGEDIWTHIGPLSPTYREAPMDHTQLFDSYGIYADRLRILDSHMARWKPRGLLGLWRDNRDSYQWWTLWAVIVFGGLTLLISLIGIGVNAAQMVAQFQSVQR